MSDARTVHGTALFVLAHHDDEVFCAGHLLRALCAGRRVRLLWATAGGLAPAARRCLEGERVGRLLRLAPGDVRDLRLRDQQAVRHLPAIVAAGEELLGPADGTETPLVYVPAYEGGHPDHDAVNLAVQLLRTQRPTVAAREYPLYRRGRRGLSVQSPWPASGTTPRPYEILVLDADALALRRRLVGANASQALPSLLPLMALAWAQGRARTEPSRPLPVHDYARPPHEGALLYELYTRCRFAGFRAAALAALGEAPSTGAATPLAPRPPSVRG